MKNFCARARRIHLWIYRARARRRFSSLYRGINFLRSGAENPPLDLPRPDFLRSGAENPHLDLPRPDFLRSGAENPPLDLPRLGAETIFSLYRGEKFLRSGAENPHLDLPRLGAETIFSLYRGENFLRSGAENPHLERLCPPHNLQYRGFCVL